jgi:hypothetical protein
VPPVGASAALRVSHIADFMQLLQYPVRPGYQPPDDRRRHIACCGGLAHRGDPVGIPHHANTRGPSPLPVETVAALLNWPESRLHPWHGLCDADVTSVNECNRII